LQQTNIQVSEDRLNSDSIECKLNNLGSQDADLNIIEESLKDCEGKFVVQVINFAENDMVADCLIEYLGFRHSKYELRVSSSIKELSKGGFSTCIVIIGENFDVN
jgi:hypothetical protein